MLGKWEPTNRVVLIAIVTMYMLKERGVIKSSHIFMSAIREKDGT